MPEVVLGPYHLIKPLGTGGMAAVYQARDGRTGALVAVKRILPHVAADREFIQRFIHETKVMMQMKHPNILPILDAKLGPDDYYLVMPLMDRGTLRELLQTVRRLPPDTAVYMTQEMLKALDHAHMKGVIHRDLKPANIMFDSAGHVYLTDFGVARVSGMTQLTATGEVLGTPAYMAPEQALGLGLSPACDLFSMGTIFYEVLTGVNPFLMDNPVATMKQVVELEPPPAMDLNPLVPAFLEPVVARMMRKKAQDRYATALAASEDLIPYWEGRDPAKVRAGFPMLLNDPLRTIKSVQTEQARVLLARARTKWEEPDHRSMAIWEIHQAAALDPALDEARFLLERWTRLMSGGRPPESSDPGLARAEEKWKQEPENIPLLLQLGKIYRARKNYIGLMKVYQRLERLRPADSYTIGQMKGLLDRPSMGAQAAPAAEARTTPLDLLKAVPFWVYLILAVAGAIFLIGRAIGREQKNAQLPETVVEALSILDHTNETLAAVPLADPDVRLIIEKEQSGDTEDAYRSCRELLETVPSHPQKPFLLWKGGMLALGLGKFEEAADLLGQAYAHHQPPQRWQIAFPLARACIKAGQPEKAERYWEAVIAGGEIPYAPQALLERATYLIKKDMTRPARQDLDQLVKDYPDTPEAMKARALLKKY